MPPQTAVASKRALPQKEANLFKSLLVRDLLYRARTAEQQYSATARSETI